MNLSAEKSVAVNTYTSTLLDKNSHEIVCRWLKERQQLLVLYYKLCEMKPKSYTALTAARLIEFCEILIDYVSAGHFEVFEKIASSSGVAQLNTELMIKILQTTNKAIGFSDKYSQTQDYSKLCEELSRFGLLLSNRFDWEDKLIDIYVKAVNNAQLIETNTGIS